MGNECSNPCDKTEKTNQLREQDLQTDKLDNFKKFETKQKLNVSYFSDPHQNANNDQYLFEK